MRSIGAGRGPTPERSSFHRITAVLFLGTALDLMRVPDAVNVWDAAEAVEIIRSGGRAILPQGEWDEARSVLQALGMTDLADQLPISLFRRAGRSRISRNSTTRGKRQTRPNKG
jgi:hypothetical protein